MKNLVRRTTSWILSMVLVFMAMSGFEAISVKAEDSTVSINMVMTLGEGVSVDNYGFDYKIMNGDTEVSTGYSNNVSLSSISASYILIVRASSAGQTIFENGSAMSSADQAAWEAGKTFDLSSTGNINVNFQLNKPSGQGAGGGPGGGDNGGSQGQPAPKNPETISLSIESGNDLLDGPAVIDNVNVVEGKAIVEKADNHDLVFQVAFGSAVGKVTVNNTDYTPVDMGEGRIKVTVPDATSYAVKLEKAESQDVTIIWSYKDDDKETDYYVEHGKIEVLSIKRGETTIYDGKTENEDVIIDSDGGWVAIKKGDDVVLKLIPDYGYQLKSATINDQELQPQEGVSVFNLDNIQGNLHFMGAFEKQEDKISDNSTAVSNISITNGANAASSGNLSLDVKDNTNYTTDATSAITDTNKIATAVASVDLTLDNVVSKGNGQSGSAGEWSTNVTEFTNPITVALKVDATDLADGETYSIVRDHNGTLTEIEATYDATTSTLSFETNQFSTYTIVKKADKKDQWVLSDKGWWYEYADGTYPANEWVFIDEEWYFFNEAGYMETGWILTGDTWYYLDNNGAMVTGWIYDGFDWYYMESSGAMAVGWILDDSVWYYLDDDGAMVTGWIFVGNYWYYMDNNGAMLSSEWLEYNGDWYYMTASGAMATDEWIGSYYVNKDGIWE